MFTSQGKLGEFMPASKVASTFVLASIKGVFYAIKSPVIFYTNYHENSGE